MNDRPGQIDLYEATDSDLDQLVLMNQRLIDDEAYDSVLTEVDLSRRMRQFLRATEFKVFLIGEQPAAAEWLGYAIVDLSRQPIHLRHFFVSRSHRRQGIGRTAFQMLCERLEIAKLDVEVMAWNEAGKHFWRSLGFQHRYEGLRWPS